MHLSLRVWFCHRLLHTESHQQALAVFLNHFSDLGKREEIKMLNQDTFGRTVSQQLSVSFFLLYHETVVLQELTSGKQPGLRRWKWQIIVYLFFLNFLSFWHKCIQKFRRNQNPAFGIFERVLHRVPQHPLKGVSTNDSGQIVGCFFLPPSSNFLFLPLPFLCHNNQWISAITLPLL